MISRRQLYAAGEPFGDSATRREAGRIIYGGGGGGSSAPTTSTVNNVNIPAYAQPYVEDMLGRGQALTGQNVYQPYPGNRVAPTTALQNQSYGMASAMQPAPQLGQANWLGLDVANRAQNMQNNGYQAGQFSTVGPPQAAYASPFAQQTSTYGFNTPGVAQSYMNPYMQQVADIQKREAIRNSDMMGEQENATAASDGAFGGSRQAIVNAERGRNLDLTLNNIQSQAGNAAWQQAQQAFEADQGRGLQSQMANQGANLTAAGQNLQSQEANQQAGLGYGQQFLTAQQLGEQSRQFGANYGLNALGQEMNAGNALSWLGQDQFNQQMGIAGLQNQLGTQQQAYGQQAIDAAYQNFANQQEFPYRNLEFMSGLIHGLPLSQDTSTMYQAAPSPFSQLAGAGTAAYGLGQIMKKGGLVKSKAPKAKKYSNGGFTGYADGGETGGLAQLLISQIQ